jgi:hypothetical protein
MKLSLPFTQQNGCYILEGETHNDYEFMLMALPIYPGHHRRKVFVTGHSRAQHLV